MPIPSSGQLFLRDTIALEVDGTDTGTNVSLNVLSTEAGFSAPNGMQEFYDYSSVVAPTSTTLTFTSITSSQVRGRGQAWPWPRLGGAGAITSYGFYFGTNSSGPGSNTKYTFSGSPAYIYYNYFTGLNSNTTYYAWAWAANSAGEGVGSVTSAATSLPSRPYPWARSANSNGQDCSFSWSGGGQARMTSNGEFGISCGNQGGSLPNNGDFYFASYNGYSNGTTSTSASGSGYTSGGKVDGLWYGGKCLTLHLPATGGYAAGSFGTCWPS